MKACLRCGCPVKNVSDYVARCPQCDFASGIDYWGDCDIVYWNKWQSLTSTCIKVPGNCLLVVGWEEIK